MDEEDDKRICATCDKELPAENGKQAGWYCCGEYFDTQECLDKSFDGTGETWQEHYASVTSDDGSGDCYWTEWEVEVAA